jgi:hypothetical protein
VLAWNRWYPPAWRSVDVLAVALGLLDIAGTLTHSTFLADVCRLGSLALFVVIVARIARNGPSRILALLTLASILASLFGAELLDPLGVPGIWFPFNIGVARAQFIYAISVPLLACLIVRTLLPEQAPAAGTPSVR